MGLYDSYQSFQEGSQRGMQRAAQLQQLFAQKAQLERQKQQDEFEQIQFKMKNIQTGLGSGVESWQRQAAIQLRDWTSTNEGKRIFGYTVDIVDQIGSGNENLDAVLKEFKELMVNSEKKGQDGRPLMSKEMLSSSLTELTGRLVKEDSNHAENLRNAITAKQKVNDDQIKATTLSMRQDARAIANKTNGTAEDWGDWKQSDGTNSPFTKGTPFQQNSKTKRFYSYGEKATGGLTDNSVLQHFRELIEIQSMTSTGDIDPAKRVAELFKEYSLYMKKGASRLDALNKVQDGFYGITGDSGGDEDFSSLWEN